MKFTILTFKAALIFSLFPMFASAQALPVDPASLIVHHSVVETLLVLMNSKDAGKCTAPVESDIHWMCTGALQPVTKPEIHSTGCAFKVEIVCPLQTATIYGSKTTYFLNSPKPTSVQPVEAGIQFDNVSLK